MASRSPRSLSAEAPPLPALGAILAGGASRRFGTTKALATVAGRPIVLRAGEALAGAVTHPVIITHLAAVAAATALPARPDDRPDGGPLAGIQSALRWAAELNLRGALCVACDLPFLPSSLLREIVREGLESRAMAVVPESGGPAAMEPLCAWFSTDALPLVDGALDRAELRVTHLLADLAATRFPLGRVALHGEPAAIFLNVNTISNHAEAERIAARGYGVP